MSADRRRRRLGPALALVAVLLASCSSGSAGGDSSSAAAGATPVSGFVQGTDGVLLEYRDWGGDGPPIVLLTGLGNSAAVFDDLAPRLTADHRVIGLTRRGFSPSTVATDGYDVPTRAADDIAALEALGIERALLVGHSIAGDELTSIVRLRPDLVAGIVYLDAALDRSDPANEVFAQCTSLVPPIETFLDPAVDLVEVDGEVALVSMDAGGRLLLLQYGGPVPMSEVRRRFVVGPGGAVDLVDSATVMAAMTAGTNAFTPDYRGITVPVTVLVADDADPAVAFPMTARAESAVREPLVECARRIADAKRTAGADRVRAQVPGAVVEIVPGGPHYFFLQQPDLVARYVLDTARRAGW